jgi:type IV secretory pathway TraG/TraD family ATPase VirD4
VLWLRGRAVPGEGGRIIAVKSYLYKLAVFFDKISARFSKEKNIFKARYARLSELVEIYLDKVHISKKITGIFLAIGQFEHVLCIRPNKDQKELGNMLVIAKTRSGKGLNIGTNLLRWPYPTIINDIKDEFWPLTAAWREKGLDGKAYKFDPRGYGHKFDPLEGLTSDFDLRSAATTLLYRPNEGKNAIFTERAITMLVQILHAARLEHERPLPFTYKILNEGLYGVATILEIISKKHNFYPNLATKFLDINYDIANFKSNFLNDCFSTMKARIECILTKESVRCFTGSDFTAKDIITSGKHPISVYLYWPEKHLLTLSPLINLIWNSLIDRMIDHYDSVRGKGCSPVLAFLDEIFRTGMSQLPKFATSVCGRDISLLVYAQSISQLSAEYGQDRANELLGQFDTAVVHRPAPLDYETGAFIEKILGLKSVFAHSKNEHEGGTSTGENEQRVPLMPAYESGHIGKKQVIVKRDGMWATIADRLDWRQFPELVKRANIQPPQLPALSPVDTFHAPGFPGSLLTNRSAGGRGRFSRLPAFMPIYQSTTHAD